MTYLEARAILYLVTLRGLRTIQSERTYLVLEEEVKTTRDAALTEQNEL